jgi:hypothetical protein
MWISWLANYRTYWENSLFRYLHSTTLTTCGVLTQTLFCITKSLAKWEVFNVMQIQKVNDVKIDQMKQLWYVHKEKRSKKISTTSAYVSTKISPVWQTVQVLWYGIIKCQWGQTARRCLYCNIQKTNTSGKMDIFLERSCTDIELQIKIISVTNKLIMQLNCLRYSRGWCRISDKLPASIFKEVRDSKFLRNDDPWLLKCKASHYRRHSQPWVINISRSLLS